jgi:hypothetical protein
VATIPSLPLFTSGIAKSGQFNRLRDAIAFWQNPPAAMVTASSNQSISNATWTLLTFGSTSYDTDGIVTSTSRFTVQTPGRYSIVGKVVYASSATGRRWIAIRKNSTGTYVTGTLLYATNIAATSAADHVIIPPGPEFQLSAGDTLEAFTFQDSGGSLSTAASGSDVHMAVRLVQSTATTSGDEGTTLPAALEQTVLGTEDLDAVTIAGNYVQNSIANATLARHYPVASKPGHLSVYSYTGASRRAQVYIVSTDNVAWVRTYPAGGPWTAWQRLGIEASEVSDASVATAIGTGSSTQAAGDARWQRDLGIYNVKAYGATGNGVADDTSAILSAQAAAGDGGTLYFPTGTYLCSDTITAKNIRGEHKQKTILKYTGTGAAVGVPSSPVAQSYHKRVDSLTILSGGSGATGLDVNAHAGGYFTNLIVDGFTNCVSIRASTGQSLYNVFIDVTSTNASGSAFRLDNISHENRFIGCRVNFAQYGFNFISGGRNVVEACAIENCSSRGVSLPDPGSNGTRANVIMGNRFEFNTENITIFAGVQYTAVIANRFVGGTYTDNGTGTLMVDQNTGAIALGRYATASRPTAPVAGAQIYDTTLGKPIWWNGSAWRDAAGTAV